MLALGLNGALDTGALDPQAESHNAAMPREMVKVSLVAKFSLHVRISFRGARLCEKLRSWFDGAHHEQNHFLR